MRWLIYSPAPFYAPVWVLVVCAAILLWAFSGCASPERTPYWYRIYEIDPQTNEQISKEYTCFSDRQGTTKCWEEAR